MLQNAKHFCLKNVIYYARIFREIYERISIQFVKLLYLCVLVSFSTCIIAEIFMS